MTIVGVTHVLPAVAAFGIGRAPGEAIEIARAAALLRSGRLVAFGTETVYGLGARADDAAAVAAIYAVKGRPAHNPLICHYASTEAAAVDAVFNEAAWRLAAAFWPGPLTLVLPRQPGSQVVAAVSGGETLAVRVPGSNLARAMLAQVGVAVAAPSANRSGRVSPTSATHVLDELDGRIDAVLDCGACVVGLESTVLDLTGSVPLVLRPGAVTAEAIAAVVGAADMGGTGGAVRSPGMLASHYAPILPLRLNASACAADEALLAFGPPLSGAGVFTQLSETGDLARAAQRLFHALRWLDVMGAARGLRGIAAMAVPSVGLGVAINDRLTRAATRA